MTKEKAEKILPVIQAIINGQKIQVNINNRWEDVDENHNYAFLPESYEYRIKPESKYRPFKNTEECWQEMQKHQPFGWVIKHNEGKILIGEVPSDGIVLHNQRGSMFGFDEANRILTFADGIPFGIKDD